MIQPDKLYRKLLHVCADSSRFSLILVVCKSPGVRRRWQAQLYQDLEHKGIRVVAIKGDTLAHQLQRLTPVLLASKPDHPPWVLSLDRFEPRMLPLTGALAQNPFPSNKREPSPFLRRLNIERESLQQEIAVPLIFWLSHAAMAQLSEHAPDFFDFRSYVFELPEEDEPRSLPDIPRAALIAPPEGRALSTEAETKLLAKIAWLEQQSRNEADAGKWIATLSELADAYLQGQELGKAGHILDKMGAEAESWGFGEARARHALKMAALFKARKDWQASFTYLETAVGLYRKLFDTNPVIHRLSLVQVLQEQGHILSQLDQREKGLVAYEKALDLCRRDEEQLSPAMVNVLNNLASHLQTTGEAERAEGYYREALAILAGLPRRYHPMRALVLNNLGNLMADGEHYEEAIEYHDTALQLRRQLYHQDQARYLPDLCQSIYNLSFLLGEIKDYQRGRTIYNEALELISFLPTGTVKQMFPHPGQEQLRGFRIDIGEIELALQQHASVLDAAVLIRANASGEHHLVAYVVTLEKTHADVTPLREHLHERFPGYMVPAVFVSLQEIPADRNLLPAPERTGTGIEVATATGPFFRPGALRSCSIVTSPLTGRTGAPGKSIFKRDNL